MYTVCVPFVVWIKFLKKYFFSATGFIAVLLLSVEKGGRKFFNTSFHRQ